MNEPLLIGIDVGTTAVKAALFDLEGVALARFSKSHPTRRLPPDRVEQDPQDWMALVLEALTQLSAGISPGRIRAVGLCSQVNSHVFVDADGKALHPAIIWQDGRCAAAAAAIDRQVSDADKIAWWGAPLPIDASHVLSRMAWMAEHHPDIWRRTRHVLAPKDYCILQLTGQAFADPMSSFGVIDANLTYIDALIGLVPGAADRLAPLSGITAKAGVIRPGLPLAGTPMAVGTMDAWSGLFGTGALAEGEAMYLSGTSEILGIVSARKVPTPGVIAFPRCEGIVLHAGPTQAGGASIAWLAQLLGRSPEALSALAAGVDPARDLPVFLPHLQGERAPIWDIFARASLSGMDGSMGPGEISRAVFEGVAFSVRWLAESLMQSADVTVGIFNAAGGGMASDIWCQIRADVLKTPIRRLSNLDAGVLGAAIAAGVGAGLFPTIAEAARRLVVTDRIFEPDPAMADRLDWRYGLYRDLYADLKPFNTALAARPA